MRRSLGPTFKYTSLVVATLVVLVPLVVVLFASLKTSSEYATSNPLSPPKSWLHFDNFVIAFDQGRMLLGFVNTLVILVVAVTGTVLVGTAVAYALNRFDFRGRRVVVGLFLVATLVPGVTTQVATFQVVASMGLFNTRWSAVLLYMGTDIVSIYIFLQFMQSIPRSLDEAAMIDGASRFTIYYRIILPLLRPAIVTVVIIKGVAIYNEFYIPFLYMPSRDLAVISTSLFRFTGPFGSQWEIIAAGTMIVILPTMLLFVLLQKWIYAGVAAGSVK